MSVYELAYIGTSSESQVALSLDVPVLVSVGVSSYRVREELLCATIHVVSLHVLNLVLKGFPMKPNTIS